MKVIFLIIALLTIALIHANSFASSPREGGGANAQAQALIQQLGAERTRLSAENAKLKKKIKDLEGELDTINNENSVISAELGKTQKQLVSKSDFSDELIAKLKEAKDKLDKLIAKFRETITNLRQVENENAQRAQEIVRLERELNTCAVNNVALSKLGFEVLENYENKGFWVRAGQKEPFTQIKRVQIENLVDDYTYLIEDQEYSLPESIQQNAQ